MAYAFCCTYCVSQVFALIGTQRLQLTLGDLLLWLRDNLLTERPELFLQGSTV